MSDRKIDRSHLTERVTLPLLMMELRRAARPLAVIIAGIAVAGYAAQYILTHINGGVGSTHVVRVAIADATGVVPDRTEVRFEGIEAGTVQSVDLLDGHAVLEASVATKFGPVYRNATAVLRPNTPLQDMYLDILARGTRGAGTATPQFVIPLSQTQSPINLSDVLDLFQPNVRARLYDLLDQLGGGLQDRGAALRQAFIQLAPLLRIAGNMSDQLAVRAQYTRDLVHNTAVLSSVLAGRSRQLRNLVLSGTDTLEALSTGGGRPLESTIMGLPPTLDQAEGTLSQLGAMLPALDQATSALEPVAGELPASLHQLQSFADAADPAVRALEPPVERLVPLASELRPLSGRLHASVRSLAPQVGDVDHITAIAAKCPTTLYTFFNWTASVAKYFDAYGGYTRGDFGFGLETQPFVNAGVITPAFCPGGTTIGAVPTPGYPGP